MRFSVGLGMAAALMFLLPGLGCVGAGQFAKIEIPEEMKPMPDETVDVDALIAEYGLHDGVVLRYEEAVEHTGGKEMGLGTFLFGAMGSSWGYHHSKRERILVINPDNQKLTTTVYRYLPDKMYMRVVRPDGRVSMYSAADMVEDVNEEGQKVHKFAYPDIQRGTIIEEGWENTFAVSSFLPPMSHRFPLQFYVPCEQLKITFAVPEWWDIQVKEIAEGELPVFTDQLMPEFRKRVISHEAEHVPALRSEPYGPSYDELVPHLAIKVNALKMESMEWKNVETWQELAEGIRKYSFKHTFKEHAEVASHAKLLTAAATTPEEQLECIFNWVRDSVEWANEDYNGDPRKVIKQRKGNPIDVTATLYGLLDGAGFDADIVAVHSCDDGFFDPDYVEFEQLGAPGVLVRVSGQEYALFPYMPFMTYDHVPVAYRNQRAMILTAGKEGFLCQVPDSRRNDYTSQEVCTVEIEAGGLVRVHQNRCFRGVAAHMMKRALKHAAPSEKEDLVKDWMVFTGADVVLDTFAFSSVESSKDSLNVEMRYTVRNAVTVTPEEAILRAVGLLDPLDRTDVRIDTLERRTPIRVWYSEVYDRELHIVPPQGWALSAVPKDVSIENDFGKLQTTWSVGPTDVVIKERLELRRIDRPKEEIGQLALLVGDISPVQVASLAFSVPTAEPKSGE